MLIICLLILRGPQTPGELNTNSGRLYEFDSIEEVQEILDKLSSGENPFIKQLSRRPGQKEVRYVHLLGGTDWSEESFATEASTRSSGDLETRLAKVETGLAELKEAFDKLMKELS